MIGTLRRLSHILARRRKLATMLSLREQYDVIEESCVPSYLHGNLALALAAWWRLVAAAELAAKHAPAGPVLDFGASVGELRHLLEGAPEYAFVEENETLVAVLMTSIPDARRHTLDDLPEQRFATIFALDSLEHNHDRSQIAVRLARALADDGVLVTSGPSENATYRLGRRLAGFQTYAHDDTVYDVERDVATCFERIDGVRGPLGLPAFILSVWHKLP